MNRDLYNAVVMEHALNRKNHREIKNPTHIERGFNPSCGDDLTLMVRIADGKVEDAGYIGHGCAISKAAISIMIDQILGRSVEEAAEIAKIYLAMIRGEHPGDESIGDLVVFETLKNMPARVKCGTLGAHCVKVIADKVSQED